MINYKIVSTQKLQITLHLLEGMNNLFYQKCSLIKIIFRHGGALSREAYSSLGGNPVLSSSVIGQSQSMPQLAPLLQSPFASSMKLPTISPVMQAAGVQTFQGNPLTAIINPVIPPPVPLVPPSLFSPHPSMPLLRDPRFSDLHWDRYRNLG